MSTSVRTEILSARNTQRPHAQCRAVVVIPAKDEEKSLSSTLDALQAQCDCTGDRLPPELYEVLLLLNNCSDRSEAVASSYAQEHRDFNLHVLSCELPLEVAHVGTARRALMDLACERLELTAASGVRAILSTDADTRVASDWIARNLQAIDAGADVVGGVIELFPEEYAKLDEGIRTAYKRDRLLQTRVARLESLLDPDEADPWPRHLEHFGASLACTPEIYRRSGGLPAVKPLEDVAFIDRLRRIGARIRHDPGVHVSTSARLDGRTEIGLSGQLRVWQDEASFGIPPRVDSVEWMEHRFRTMRLLRRWNKAGDPGGSEDLIPEEWRERVRTELALHLPIAQFLEVIDCDGLIEQMFVTRPDRTKRKRHIEQVLKDLEVAIRRCEANGSDAS